MPGEGAPLRRRAAANDGENKKGVVGEPSRRGRQRFHHSQSATQIGARAGWGGWGRLGPAGTGRGGAVRGAEALLRPGCGGAGWRGMGA